FKYRKGKHWEYVYIYRIQPFSDEEKKEILEESAREYGFHSTSDFQHLKMSNPKCAAQNQHVRNIESKKNSIKEKSIKETNNLNLNLEEENNSNIEDIIWNLEVPMPLRQKIKTKIKA